MRVRIGIRVGVRNCGRNGRRRGVLVEVTHWGEVVVEHGTNKRKTSEHSAKHIIYIAGRYERGMVEVPDRQNSADFDEVDIYLRREAFRGFSPFRPVISARA
jgi:hypothetical protein